MFRLQESNLPEDPTYPADLKELGYFINAAGQFRMIDYPDMDFIFHFSNDERVNEVRREAYQICQRDAVMSRLSALGLEKLYLPQLTFTKPENVASVPILAPPAEILKTRKRVIVLINDTLQDLGILAYRQLQRKLGVNGGSIVNFAKEIVKRSTDEKENFDIFKDGNGVAGRTEETPGLIVMNCGQFLYSYKFARAMSVRSWSAMPRKSACHESSRITDDNHIEGNRDATEHIRFVIQNVIQNKAFVAEGAEVYVVAIENGAENLLDILGSDLEKYGSRITAMALINSYVSGNRISNPDLKAFLHQRARQWKVTSSSNNPRKCIDVPSQYYQEVEMLVSSVKDKPAASLETDKPAKPISWLESTSLSGAATVADALKQLAISVQPREELSPESVDNVYSMEPICPCFADDENPFGSGECVFTSPLVQQCILDFFEEVAQNPGGFRNPVFKSIHSDPQDYGEGGEGRAYEGIDDAAYQPLQTSEMLPEQAELNAKKEEHENMKAALLDTPEDNAELQVGREGLKKRIVKVEGELETLTRKTLAMGGMKAGEAKELRDNWKQVGGGPKIMFAGAMVDSELVKGAGMDELAEAELAALDRETGNLELA